MMNVNRRVFLTGGAAVLAARNATPSTPSCTLIGEQEVGPYYIEYEKVRRDVTEGKPGVPLKLRVALVDAKRCTPLENAALDIWHCDALGIYSGFTANSMGGRPDGRGPFGPPPDFGPGGPGPGGPGGGRGRGRGPSDETRFLRGVQFTDRNGIAEFATVFPGWYQGRAIHIHVKVHLGGNATGDKYAGGHVSHTGQLFFPEDIIEKVAKMEPYSKRLSVHRTTQEEDHVFNQQHGSDAMTNLTRLSSGSDAGGFLATVMLAVDPEATPAPVGMGPGGRGFGGPPPSDR
jgi:protocatechuate 3,4-dioxygenase beta subunit